MDSPSITTEVIIILLLIIANGIFAMTETAVVSSRRVRLERKAQQGNAGAKTALELVSEPTPLLSTIQIGITLIGIFNGAFGGATIADVLADHLAHIPALAPYSGALSLAIVVTLITFLSLIIGELVPKRLALNNPEGIASVVAKPMVVFSRLVAPMVKLLVFSTNLALKLLRIPPATEPTVTEEEVRLLIKQGAEAGTFDKVEEDMVQQIFRLSNLRATALMTPRTQVVWLDLEDDLQKNLQIIRDNPYSSFPVARGDLDEIVGLVYTRDLFSSLMEKGEVNLEKLARQPLFVPESMKAFKVLELFKKTGTHEAIVQDEYGGVAGFITLHDLLEEIVGDMPLYHEREEPLIIQREDGSWLLDGMLPIDEFKELFNLTHLPHEDEVVYYTLGGFVTSYLGSIPQASQSFQWNGLKFEIVDTDRARVDKVLVQQIDNSNSSEKKEGLDS